MLAFFAGLRLFLFGSKKSRMIKRILQHSGVPVLEGNAFPEDAAPRLLFYCASNVGLGHFGRVMGVIQALRQHKFHGNILLATDAPESVLSQQAHDLAVLRLPSFAFSNGHAFDEQPKNIGISSKQLHVLRRNVLLSLVHSYQPHVLWMDTLPHGKRDEMLPALRLMKHRGGKALLCMRDIPAAPEESFKFTDPLRVEKCFSFYERVFIAGDEKFFDSVAEYQWPPSVREKTQFLGFFTPVKQSAKVKRDYKQVVAAFGGGWEVDHLLPPLLEALQSVGHEMPLRTNIYTGPAVSQEKLSQFQQKLGLAAEIKIEQFSASFSETLASADLALLQAGSTVFQILESGTPVLLFLREYKDREQELRAERLARLPNIQIIDKTGLAPDLLKAQILDLLARSPLPRATGFAYGGAQKAALEILNILNFS